MLILTRKPGESLYIGDNIKITIVEIKGHQVRVGIDAPTELRIYREEIYLQILEENKKAAEAARCNEDGLDSLSIAWSGRGDNDDSSSKKRTHLSPTVFTSTKKVGASPEVVVRRKKKSSDE